MKRIFKKSKKSLVQRYVSKLRAHYIKLASRSQRKTKTLCKISQKKMRLSTRKEYLQVVKRSSQKISDEQESTQTGNTSVNMENLENNDNSSKPENNAAEKFSNVTKQKTLSKKSNLKSNNTQSGKKVDTQQENSER